MTAIEYELHDETEVLSRDVVHTEKDGWVVAFNERDDGGVKHKIQIPKERVVKIYRGSSN